MNWLKEVRVCKGLTQEEVAQKSSISPQQYSFIEQGIRKPSMNVAIRIARTLEFDWELFFVKL